MTDDTFTKRVEDLVGVQEAMTGETEEERVWQEYLDQHPEIRAELSGWFWPRVGMTGYCYAESLASMFGRIIDEGGSD